MNARVHVLVAGLLLGLVSCSSDVGVGVSRSLEMEAFLAKGGGAKLHKPTPNSTVTMDAATCEIAVNYTWQYYPGGTADAVLELYELANGSFVIMRQATVARQNASNGSADVTFSLTGTQVGARTIEARGHLLDSKTSIEVANATSTQAQSTCN
jgi:hypothetical protein